MDGRLENIWPCSQKLCVVLCVQSCLTLCDFMNCSSPGSSVLGVFQARIWDWIAIFFSQRISLTLGSNLHLLCLLHCKQILYHWATGEALSQKMKWSEVKSLSCVWLFVTPWTVAHQAPLSMGFSRQEYWSGLPFPSPGDLPDPGIETGSPAL